MIPFTQLQSPAIAFDQRNVDTDLIVPGVYLKGIERAGLGKHAFEALRGDPANIFDQGIANGAAILVAGDNFGCGSSREHAAWALTDMGIRAVIAPSFADIFSGNAFKNGILLVALPQGEVDRILETARLSRPITIDLERCRVETPDGGRFAFKVDPFRRRCLLAGIDEIGLTEQMEPDIAAYETALPHRRPWLTRRA